MHEHFVIGGEDPKQFEALAAELEAEFNPQSAEERERVVRATSLLWRLRRALVCESALIESYRAERAQTNPEARQRYNEAFNQAREPFFEQLLKKDRCEKACVDAAPKEKTERTPKMSERDGPGEKTSAKFDLSFVREPSFQDSLCNLARYETQLTAELSRTLRLLPPNRTKTERSATPGANKLKPPMSSGRIVIGGEDAQQFEDMRADFESQLKPQAASERELVERIACLSWRLRRPPAFEAALMEGARADFKPAITRGPWAIDSPELLRRFGFPDATAAELDARWKMISAERKEVEKKMREFLGDEEREDVLSDLWFMRGRDIQDQLAKMARYEAALSRQLASTHKLLHFLQTCMPAEDSGLPYSPTKR